MIGKVEGALSSRRKRAVLMLAQEPDFENTIFCIFKAGGAGEAKLEQPAVENPVHFP
jgi:hypothetical protein